MTIRTRLTFWYAGILFLSVVIITLLSLLEFRREQKLKFTAHGQPVEEDAWEDTMGLTLSCGIPAALIGLAGGWWLMRQAMKPVAALTSAAGRINEGNLHEQIPRTGNGDELDRLTEMFNAMTTRLDGSFQRIREFTLHASHELKTPLTVMHGELEIALRDTTAENRERLLSQLDEVQRLTKIVDGLSLLTKADAGLVALKKETVRLDELVRDSFADAEILAGPANIQVRLGECAQLSINGDRHRLRQLLLNLTDNAIKYNHPQGEVIIRLHAKTDRAEIVISNTGPGITEPTLSRVFDRFFRGDASHNNLIDGCGLGLSIAQWITAAHNGTIKIESQADRLTAVTVQFPLE